MVCVDAVADAAKWHTCGQMSHILRLIRNKSVSYFGSLLGGKVSRRKHQTELRCDHWYLLDLLVISKLIIFKKYKSVQWGKWKIWGANLSEDQAKTRGRLFLRRKRTLVLHLHGTSSHVTGLLVVEKGLNPKTQQCHMTLGLVFF